MSVMNWVHFLNVFYFQRAQRNPAEKLSEDRLDESVEQNQNKGSIILYIAVGLVQYHKKNKQFHGII
jgi:hypothetical protein